MLRKQLLPKLSTSFERYSLHRDADCGPPRQKLDGHKCPFSFATEPILQEFVVRMRVVRNFIPCFNMSVVND